MEKQISKYLNFLQEQAQPPLDFGPEDVTVYPQNPQAAPLTKVSTEEEPEEIFKIPDEVEEDPDDEELDMYLESVLNKLKKR